MLILRDLMVRLDKLSVFDTKDGTIDNTHSLKMVSDTINAGKIKIRGLKPGNSIAKPDEVYIPMYNVIYSPSEARAAIERYQKSKMRRR